MSKEKLQKPPKQIKPKKMRINGDVVEFVTVAQLAAMSDRKPVTMRKWEKKNWLPAANFHSQPVLMPDNTTRPGARLYSMLYAKKIAALIKTVERGVDIDNEVIRQIALLMKQEKEHYSKK